MLALNVLRRSDIEPVYQSPTLVPTRSVGTRKEHGNEGMYDCEPVLIFDVLGDAAHTYTPTPMYTYGVRSCFLHSPPIQK
jgi:hypothetical protein